MSWQTNWELLLARPRRSLIRSAIGLVSRPVGKRRRRSIRFVFSGNPKNVPKTKSKHDRRKCFLRCSCLNRRVLRTSSRTLQKAIGVQIPIRSLSGTTLKKRRTPHGWLSHWTKKRPCRFPTKNRLTMMKRWLKSNNLMAMTIVRNVAVVAVVAVGMKVLGNGSESRRVTERIPKPTN